VPVLDIDFATDVANPAASPAAAAEQIREQTQFAAVAEAGVVTGVSLTAGYLLLNTRAVYWFLSAVLARPAIWRPLDPLEVIYAWERDPDARTGDEDSLAALLK
jgi:hypothetical protein